MCVQNKGVQSHINQGHSILKRCGDSIWLNHSKQLKLTASAKLWIMNELEKKDKAKRGFIPCFFS